MIQGHFIHTHEGKLFLTQFGRISNDTAILCLPPIVEELNLSRAVIAKQAQAFAKEGFSCFILDYLGTGDSEGEFDEVDCNIWQQNILAAGDWLLTNGVTKIILWGVRFGALLMLSIQEEIQKSLPIEHQIIWKPVLSGKQFSNQFLRIKMASSLSNSGVENKNWRNYILEDNSVEIAGYHLTKRMLTSMDNLRVTEDLQPISKIDWLELTSDKKTPLIEKITRSWFPDIYNFTCVSTPEFWKIPETFALPELEAVNLDIISRVKIHE